MEESVVEYSTAEPDELWLWVSVLLRSAGDVKCVRIQTEGPSETPIRELVCLQCLYDMRRRLRWE